MIVLDTNVISETFRRQPEPRVVEWLTSLTDDVAITTITLAELFAGVRRLPEGRRKSALESNIHAALLPFRATRSILSFDESAAEAYAEITADRERAGLPISMADAQIAAICRAHATACATRNTKDFAAAGVSLINPWDR
ncbi:type II toxin-antitoxin system VapC family toxin [Kribbia dieselivorans]|uniref:type II toxin-antitoxin system VapC family toxin n=1 Tax=Kribbia dieselivorans TaxID=331526 RepID=UPI0008395DE5|nr:type II toxin-antitoxin system VapC family toxin [Kribbia dieselivorans]